MLVKRTYNLPKNNKKEVKHNTIYGHIWVSGKRKPIYSYRRITKGKDEGLYECIYLKSARRYRKVKVKWEDITFIPVPKERGKKPPKLVKRR